MSGTRRVRRRIQDSVSDAPEVGRTDGGSRRPSKRVVLVPGSEEGTPQSIQDRVPSTEPASGMEIPTTVPASSEALRAVMEPHLNHRGVRPTVMDSIQVGKTQQAHQLVNRRDVVESSSRVRVEPGVDEVRTWNRFAELSEDSDEESVESAIEDTEVVVPHVGSRVIGQAVAVPASASFEEFGRVAEVASPRRSRDLGPQSAGHKRPLSGCLTPPQHSATIASS